MIGLGTATEGTCRACNRISEAAGRWLLALISGTALTLLAPIHLFAADTIMHSTSTTSFAAFDRRAHAGEVLTVVFFGGSLTWGANSTDPFTTSYRAILARRLEEHYPRAHWQFIDAAIGGTGSRLGVFRFDRDVARHKPDLVCIEFTVNDFASPPEPDRLASYETLIRRAVSELRVPTLQALFCTKNMVDGDLARFPIRDAHLAIAAAYGTAVGDAFTLMRERRAAGQLDLDLVWDNPSDTCHPCDRGYELYAQAVWDGLMHAIATDRTPVAPIRMINASTYQASVRARLSTLAPLPVGWSMASPARISAWYDCLMSRWLDDVAAAKCELNGALPGASPEALPGAWELKFHGSTVVLFGESTTTSGKLHVSIDGATATALAGGVLDCRSGAGGTFRLDATLAVGLDPHVDHTIRLEPFDDRVGPTEWRIESLCVAGDDAKVWH